MINRKLLEVLSRFGEEDMKKFESFLRSPYFNSGSNAVQVVDLYKYIIGFKSDENHPSLAKNTVFEVFYPGKIFKENEKSALDTLTSDLFKLVKTYLIQRDRERCETETTQAIPLLRFYRKSGLDERYTQLVKTTRKIIDSQKRLTADLFYERFCFEEEINIFQTLNNTYEDDTNIERMLRSLDLFFMISKLSHSMLLSVQKLHSAEVKYEMNDLHQAALKMAREGYSDDVAIARLLVIALGIFEELPQLDNLKTFNSAIIESKNELLFSDYKYIQTVNRAFWGLKFMQTATEYIKSEVFEIYKKHLDEDLFYHDGKLPMVTLNSLTNIGLSFKAFDWVKKLLTDHPVERLIGTKYLSEGYHLNWAEYYLALREHDKTIEHIEYKMFENPLYSIVADIILIRVYYETESELLDSRIKALEQKIRRTSFSSDLKKSYQLFLQKVDKLNRYRYQKSSPKYIKLVEEIKSTPGLRFRNWLLEKVTTP